MRTSSIFLSAIGLAVITSAIPLNLLAALHNRDVVVAPQTTETLNPPALKANQDPVQHGFHSKIPLREGSRKDGQSQSFDVSTTSNVEGSRKDVQPQPFDPSTQNQAASTNLNPETGTEIGKGLKVHLHRGDGTSISHSNSSHPTSSSSPARKVSVLTNKSCLIISTCE